MSIAIPDEENYSKAEIVDYLDKVKSYLTKNKMSHKDHNMVESLKYSIQANHMAKPTKTPSITSYFGKK